MNPNERQVAIYQLNRRFMVDILPFSWFRHLNDIRHTHGLRVIGTFKDFDVAQKYLVEIQRLRGMKLPDGYTSTNLPIFPARTGDRRYDRMNERGGIHIHIVDTFVKEPSAFSQKAVATG